MVSIYPRELHKHSFESKMVLEPEALTAIALLVGPACMGPTIFLLSCSFEMGLFFLYLS